MKTIYFTILSVLFYFSAAYSQWQQINSGLPGNSVYGLATDGQYIYSGSSIAGVYRSSDKGNNWFSVNNGLPNSNAWELYSNNDTLFAGFFGPGAFRSTDHGNTWDTLLVGSINSSVRGFISNNKYLFAATWGSGIFRSSDGEENWTQINNGINHLTFWDIYAIEDTLIAAGSGGGIYRSTNNGNNWAQSNNGLTDLTTYRITSSDNYIFIGTAFSGVFRSSDFGKSWLPVGPNSQTIYALLAFDTLLFAGTASSGVYISTDYGNNWETFNQGNPLGSIVELMHDETYLYAATLGGGIYRYNKNNITSADEIISVTPASFELKQNYPNPFNPTTKIKYTVADAYYASAVPVRLVVFDVLGNEISTLVNEVKPAGNYEVVFNASDLSSGVYFYRLTANNFIETRKFVLMK